jgi:putative flavoprotein involved in K+ transport
MRTHVDTVIAGGGQAGLAVSYYLTRQGRDHLVLEQSDRAAEAWRNHRWDSFTLNTPNWQTRLPGAEYSGNDPDGFMSRSDVVAYLEGYVARFHLPVRYRMRVARVDRDRQSGLYRLRTGDGRLITAENVIIATGLYQAPKLPKFGSALPPTVRQVHSDAYRNPGELLPGAVLVVGSAQSGAQIAEELYQAGKKVYLAVGRAGRVPRRYRGKDANWWSERLGLYDRTVDQLPSPRAKFAGKVTCKVSRMASSAWRPTCGTTLRAPTRTKPLSQRPSMPTLPAREWSPQRKRCQSFATAFARR